MGAQKFRPSGLDIYELNHFNQMSIKMRYLFQWVLFMSPGLVTNICGSENSVWQLFAQEENHLNHDFEFKNVTLTCQINSSFIFLAKYDNQIKDKHYLK